MLDQSIHTWVPAIVTGSSIVRDQDKLFIRNGPSVYEVADDTHECLLEAIQEVDGKKDVQGICRQLSGRYAEETVLSLLLELDAKLLRFTKSGPAAPRPGAYSVLLLGHSEVSESIGHAFKNVANTRLTTYRVSAAGDDARAVAVQANGGSVAGGVAGTLLDAAQTHAHGAAISTDGLAGVTEGVDLVVCVLEGAPRGVFAAVNEVCASQGLPCIFVTTQPDEIRVGPTFVPGRSTCYECGHPVRLSTPHGDDEVARLLARLGTAEFTVSSLRERQIVNEVAARVFEESVKVLEGTDADLRYLESVETFHRDKASGKSFLAGVYAKSTCTVCNGDTPAPAGKLEKSIAFDLSLHKRFPPAVTVGNDRNEYASVMIVGGGSAGYLTALALRKQLPHLKVTLAESSKIPIIGVGEATIPTMVHLLHTVLGFDYQEFYQEVRPTWKLGIKFQWGSPGDYYFNYPFGPQDIAAASLYHGQVTACSLKSMIMSADAGCVYRTEGGAVPYNALWNHEPNPQYAYHLDNQRFTAYLKKKAVQYGVQIVDTTVEQVITTGGAEEVDHLVDADGNVLKADFYVDCSGFRSLLLGKALKLPFQSFASSLYTDTAITGNVPNANFIKPYTSAITMRNGWCWNIPQEGEDHVGYVFSSAFCNHDEALTELTRRYPTIGEVRTVKFVTGRREHFWKGNVAGIGNAYGFVEPLESTGLHMITLEIFELIANFPRNREALGVKAALSSKKINAQWDYLRWFLSVHFKFNKRMDTNFWRECNEKGDISGIADLIDIYKRTGPLSYLPQRTKNAIGKYMIMDDTFGFEGLDLLLFGQGVRPANLASWYNPAHQLAWNKRYDAWRNITRQCVSHEEALRVLKRYPQLFQRH